MALSEGDEVVFNVDFVKGDTMIDVGESGTVKTVCEHPYIDYGQNMTQRTSTTYFVIAKRMLWMCFPGEVSKKGGER